MTRISAVVVHRTSKTSARLETGTRRAEKNAYIASRGESVARKAREEGRVCQHGREGGEQTARIENVTHSAENGARRKMPGKGRGAARIEKSDARRDRSVAWA